MLNNFAFVLDNEIAGCGHPDSFGDIEEALQDIKQRGFGALVSLDEDGLDRESVDRAGLAYLHLAIPDFAAPEMEQAEEFLAFADEQRTLDHPILLHCRGGYGRTGTMIAAYLISQGSNWNDAVHLVRSRRPGSIETRGQERFLMDFEIHLRTAEERLDRRRVPRD